MQSIIVKLHCLGEPNLVIRGRWIDLVISTHCQSTIVSQVEPHSIKGGSEGLGCEVMCGSLKVKVQG